jgi:asparagine synthase (glutamine-hydrolysing)
MCGIVGFRTSSGVASAEAHAAVARMAHALAHRGPDDEGLWVDENVGVALGHRRLSILDLSAAGHQPMHSASGRYIIIFNGEIYNHRELRTDLTGSTWRGRSDTETLLAGFDCWGIEATLKKSIGMFALCVWDRSRRELILARDRLGEKPLYYGWQGGTFLFASELKAIRTHRAFSPTVCRGSLQSLLRRGYIPCPDSIYSNIRKLPPGSVLRVGESDAATAKPTAYWSITEVVREAPLGRFSGSEKDAIEILNQKLRQAVARQMIADVPLGAFLSGGVDSSTIVALMQAQSTRAIKTFTIGFPETSYDEAGHARLVAGHLGTDHTELYVDERMAQAVVPQLPSMFDEPFGDSSAIPTALVAQLAKKSVTVSLSGDGGDELFGGYSRYGKLDSEWQRSRSLPRLFRNAAACALEAGPRRLHSFAAGLRASSLGNFYDARTSQWGRPDRVVVSGHRRYGQALTVGPDFPELDSVERMMAIDTVTYLPDDILVKVDRAAMATSLETRVPMLDHQVVEFAWSLPLAIKCRRGVGKSILRQVLKKYVPTSLTERPKMGFGVPLDMWLRGPLRAWAEDLLAPARIRHEGYFHATPIREVWNSHQSGKRNHRDVLWPVLMFQAWLAAGGCRPG